MRNVVFCTFTRGYGMNPGLVRHGFIDVEDFKQLTDIPESCIYVDIYQRSLRLHYMDKSCEEVDLEYWGFSRNIFHMCKDMADLEFPFQCHCVVNSVLGEYE